MIKGVLFDIDGVLLDSFESNLDFFQDFMKKIGYKPPTAEEYAPLSPFILRDTIKNLTGLTDKDADEIDSLCHRAEVEDFGTKPEILSEGVEETIKELSKYYSLAIVTSREKIFVYQPPLDILKPFFKVAISREDTQTHKPNPEPLLLAAEKLSLSPKECVYIGDAESDRIAARSAKMNFLFYSKQIISGAEVSISNFRSIPVLLKTI
jgi:HAD superfamily hydrolase (TIGR01549 family)